MPEEKKGFFGRLVSGLAKTRANIVAGMDNIFNGFSAIDDEFYEEIEETLILGDIGINATNAIIQDLKTKVKEQKLRSLPSVRSFLFPVSRSRWRWERWPIVLKKKSLWFL